MSKFRITHKRNKSETFHNSLQISAYESKTPRIFDRVSGRSTLDCTNYDLSVRSNKKSKTPQN